MSSSREKKTKQSYDLDDLLEEDQTIPSQQYAIISYLLPDPERNELDRVMFKFRGAYRTMEECQKKADRLSKMDENSSGVVSLNVIHTGQWGRLESQDEIAKNNDVEFDYQNELMNDMMKGKKEQKEKVDEEFETRRELRRDQLKFDGSKEGQKYLNSLKETIVSIRDRYQKLQSDLETHLESKEYVEKRLVYNQQNAIVLQNLKNDNNSEIPEFAESENIKAERLKVLNESIKKNQEQKEFLGEQLELLISQKNNINEFSLENQIEINKNEIKYSLENQKYIEDKINYTKQQIQETKKMIEKRDIEDSIDNVKELKDKDAKFKKECLIEAAKIMYSKDKDNSTSNTKDVYTIPKLGNTDDYEKSFE